MADENYANIWDAINDTDDEMEVRGKIWCGNFVETRSRAQMKAKEMIWRNREWIKEEEKKSNYACVGCGRLVVD